MVDKLYGQPGLEETKLSALVIHFQIEVGGLWSRTVTIPQYYPNKSKQQTHQHIPEIGEGTKRHSRGGLKDEKAKIGCLHCTNT